MTQVEIGLLGPLRVVVDGQAIALPGERLPVLLAVLAVSADQTVPAERIATAVWGMDSGVDARTNVQSNVRRLRRLLGDSLVQTRGAGYALDVEPEAVDALRFAALLDAGRVAEALALWRGDPFDLRVGLAGPGVRGPAVGAVPRRCRTPWRGDRACRARRPVPAEGVALGATLEALRAEGRDAEGWRGTSNSGADSHPSSVWIRVLSCETCTLRCWPGSRPSRRYRGNCQLIRRRSAAERRSSRHSTRCLLDLW